ncbi:MAG TPA: superoxide dismutase family protein [Thermoanaerobaculia bacterium]|nr:superoxide dismutase family protein [Thermoanaerobaculia bacterium]
MSTKKTTALLQLVPGALLLFSLACGGKKDAPAPSPTPAPAPASTPAAPAGPEPRSATARLSGREGTALSGAVTFTETTGGVAIVAHLTGIQGSGAHGFHIHEKGDCSAPDFSSAGAHFNPAGAPHAGPGAGSHHAGDLGNVEVGADGSAHFELVSNSISLGDGPTSVIGLAVVLHEKADDLATQPTGNSGGRIACGIIVAAAGQGTPPQELGDDEDSDDTGDDEEPERGPA